MAGSEMMAGSVQPKMGLVGATSFVIGTIIGSGIFITANFMLKSTGSWGLALVTWGLSGVAAMCGALSWAELASRLPKQGGTYIYIREGLGDFPAFLYIITRVLLTNPCAQAVQGLAAATYLLAPLSPCPSPGALQIMAAALTLLMTALHCASTETTTKLNTFITGVKVTSLLAIGLAGMVTYIQGNSPTLEPFLTNSSSSPSDWVTAIYGGYWAYAGWQGIPSAIEDMRNPKRTYLLSVVLGLSAVTILYILVNVSFLLVLTPEEIKSSEVLVLTFGSSLSSLPLSTPFSLLIFLSLFGALLGNGFISGRFAFAAARMKHLPRFLSLLQKESNTPFTAQLLHGVITVLLLTITHKLYIILRLFVFVSIGFDLLVLLSLFVLRFRKCSPPASLKVPLIVPVLYTVFLLAIIVTTVVQASDLLMLIPVVFLLLLSLAYWLLVRTGLLYRQDLSHIDRGLAVLFLLVPDQGM